MDVAALVVAIMAAGMSAWALVYARNADRRGARRAELDEGEVLDRHQAWPSADYVEHEDVGGRRVYRFRVINTGAETAVGTLASLIDSNGDPVDVLVDLHDGRVEEESFKPLLPRVFTSQLSVDLEMSIKQEDLTRGPLRLCFEWSDKTGSPRKTSKVEVPTG